MTFLSDLFGRTEKSPPVSRFEMAQDHLARSRTSPEIAPFAADYDGYLRQAAVEHCVALGDPALLPVVASRLNDWVDQVRAAARAGIMTLAPRCSPAELLAILPAVRRLLEARRTDHALWIAEFEALLVMRLCADDVKAAIHSPDMVLSRAAFQLARTRKLIAQEDLIDLALEQRGDIVLAQGALALITELPLPRRQHWYQKLATCSFLVLRVASLRARLHEETDAAQALARTALFDTAVTIRDVAASHLRHCKVDLRGLYRGLLLEPSTVARVACIALEGLRASADVALVEQFTRASAPAVRLAAFASWLRIAPQRKDDIAMLALRDTAPSVRRFAVDTVCRQGAYLPFEQAHAVLAPLHDYRNLLALARSDPWQWLETMVWVAANDTLDVTTTRMLERSAQAWCRTAPSRYTRPTARLAALFDLPDSVRALEKLGINDTWKRG
ncbi:hypothetical protein [Massilia sp. S19_KUP03_FR1]|uniref:hypothetical protein n=1 Tax=Massilia sp. S19_KUP03_FR1 TaxID=3025503 RepID=UPI002FCCBE35